MLHFLVWANLAALRPKALLVAENLCLRQQLLVLQRRHPQARLRNADRQFWICASRWFAGWLAQFASYCEAYPGVGRGRPHARVLVWAIKSTAPKER